MELKKARVLMLGWGGEAWGIVGDESGGTATLTLPAKSHGGKTRGFPLQGAERPLLGRKRVSDRRARDEPDNQAGGRPRGAWRS